MKPASNAPVYAALYKDFAEHCRQHGYALAIHGSLRRDFDIIAIPWVDKPSLPSKVIEELCKSYCIDKISGPTNKLHGRICYTISIGFGDCSLDFSFMPALQSEHKLES